MNTDIRISTDFFDNPKTLKLERRIGAKAARCLIALWIYAASLRPDGQLTDMDGETIEISAGWDGEATAFFKELLDLHWLDQEEVGSSTVYSLHDWTEHNHWASEAETRSAKSRFSALALRSPDVYKKLKG